MGLLGTVWTNDDGQDLIEYALLAALVAVGVTAILTTMKNSINNTFNSVVTALSGA